MTPPHRILASPAVDIMEDATMKFFVATAPEHIPSGVTAFVAVDGQVSGARETWDHHVTGEKINLDAMPASIDLNGVDGVGTHMMDADSIISAAVVALGGEAHVPERYRPVLRSCAHWCDHLYKHPAFSEEINQAGLGLLFSMKNRGFAALNKVAKENHGGDGKLVTMAEKSAVFAGFCQELVDVIRSGGELPCDFNYLRVVETQEAKLKAEPDRIRSSEWSFVTLLDLRGLGYTDPIAQYRCHRAAVQISVGDHRSGNGAVTYTVGVHPAGPKPNLLPLLKRLQEAETQAWQEAGETQPDGTWGGREAVFGSPFNYGSRLTPEKVFELTERAFPPVLLTPAEYCLFGGSPGYENAITRG